MHAGPSLSLLACLATVCGVTVPLVAGVDVGLERYEDMLMQSLYKRLSQIDSTYFNGDLDELENNQLAGLPLDDYRTSRDDESGSLAEYEEGLGREQSPASIRDSEYIQHSSNAGSQGFIHMTGGAGEGKQYLTPDGAVNNIKPGEKPPEKSDKSLPFYCHPPNPCPKGLTSADGCQEDIADTAEVQKHWISTMQRHGLCTCDREHMFDCPDEPVVDAKLSPDIEDDFKSIADKILADKASATYMSGEKRLTLVAKKSPRTKRSVSNNDMEEELFKVSDMAHKKDNPYLQGEKLRTVAKKG